VLAPRDDAPHRPQTARVDHRAHGALTADAAEPAGNGCDGHYYATGSGSPLRPTLSAAAQGASVLGVIDASSKGLDQLVPTFNVPAVGTGNNSTEHPAGTAHSVAANARNNLVFVPLAANNVFPDCVTGCIAVYGRSDKDLD